jgi:hypothetical protein
MLKHFFPPAISVALQDKSACCYTIQSLFILPVSSVTQLCCGFCSFYRKKDQLHHFSLNSHALHGFSENELHKTMIEDSYSQVTKEECDRNMDQDYGVVPPVR